MKHLVVILLMGFFIIACANNESGQDNSESITPPKSMVDDGKGVGEITHVTLNDPFDVEMIARGEATYDLKCAACHKLTDQRVVGPGWKGVTEKRKPEWIMNMILNVDVMLEEDPAALELLKECLTRMPNQNLSIGDARDVLEFMYQNDAEE